MGNFRARRGDWATVLLCFGTIAAMFLFVAVKRVAGSNVEPPTMRSLAVINTPSVLCAKAGDTSNGLTCDNLVTDDTTAYQLFASSYTVPANFWASGRTLEVCAQLAIWSTGTVPNILFEVTRNGGANQLYAPSGALTPGTGKTNNGMGPCFRLVGTSTTQMLTQPIGGAPLAMNSAISQMANGIAQPSTFGSSADAIQLGWQWTTNTGIASGTYTSGIVAVGTVGQTCNLTAFNNGNSGGTATVALTGSNTIAGGTALVITNTGFASTSAATSATAGNGTATCSGAAVVATVLGGAPGNQIKLQSLTVNLMN